MKCRIKSWPSLVTCSLFWKSASGHLRHAHACWTFYWITKLTNSSELLKMEPAVTVYAENIFVQKTYLLEGDGVLSPDACLNL